MLVLSRKTDEEIVIGDQIVLKVIAIQGDKVRLGIEAPRNVQIHRKEVWLKMPPPDSVEEETAGETITENAA